MRTRMVAIIVAAIALCTLPACISQLMSAVTRTGRTVSSSTMGTSEHTDREKGLPSIAEVKASNRLYWGLWQY